MTRTSAPGAVGGATKEIWDKPHYMYLYHTYYIAIHEIIRTEYAFGDLSKEGVAHFTWFFFFLFLLISRLVKFTNVCT